MGIYDLYVKIHWIKFTRKYTVINIFKYYMNTNLAHHKQRVENNSFDALWGIRVGSSWRYVWETSGEYIRVYSL